MTNRPAHPPGERPERQSDPGADVATSQAHHPEQDHLQSGAGHDAASDPPATPRYNDFNMPLLATISIIAVALTIVSAAAMGAVANQLQIREIRTKEYLPPVGETYAAQLAADAGQLNAPAGDGSGRTVLGAAIATTIEQFQSDSTDASPGDPAAEPASPTPPPTPE